MPEVDSFLAWFVDDDEVTRDEHDAFLRRSVLLYGNAWQTWARLANGQVISRAVSPERVVLHEITQSEQDGSGYGDA